MTEGQDQEVPFETDQGDTFATPRKSKGSWEAQEEHISPSTLEAAQILNKSKFNMVKLRLLEVNMERKKGFKELVEQEEELHKKPCNWNLIKFRARLNADQILARRKASQDEKGAIKQDQTFVAIGTEEDERAIKRMNEKATDKEEEKKDESVHEEVKEAEGAKKRKLGTRRKLKAKRRKHTSGLTREDDDLKICLHIAPDEDKVIDVESLDHQYPLEDLKTIYELVMEEYKDRLPEGFDRMLWGDLMIMFNPGDTTDFCTGLVFHMLVERRYPLTKEVLSKMLELKLETEEESSMASRS
ncbi:hypothetical protein Tco_0642979 [Tanacetum coccineum]